jgi:hypothetical protein
VGLFIYFVSDQMKALEEKINEVEKKLEEKKTADAESDQGPKGISRKRPQRDDRWILMCYMQDWYCVKV